MRTTQSKRVPDRSKMTAAVPAVSAVATVQCFFALIGVVLMIVGCQKRDVAVRGNVTADGEPVASGAITLVSMEAGGKSFGATIRNGAFDFGTQVGLNSGQYRVQLDGFQTTGRTINDVQRGPIPEKIPLVVSDNAKAIEISSESAHDVQIEFHSKQAKQAGGAF